MCGLQKDHGEQSVLINELNSLLESNARSGATDFCAAGTRNEFEQWAVETALGPNIGQLHKVIALSIAIFVNSSCDTQSESCVTIYKSDLSETKLSKENWSPVSRRACVANRCPIVRPVWLPLKSCRKGSSCLLIALVINCHFYTCAEHIMWRVIQNKAWDFKWG